MESVGGVGAGGGVGCVFGVHVVFVGRIGSVGVLAEPAFGFEFFEIVVGVAGGMDRVLGIRWRACRPGVGVAVSGEGDEIDVCSGWDGEFLVVADQGLGGGVAKNTFGDCGHWGYETQLFGQDCTGHGPK